jgi:hypothetical protein
MKTFLSKLKTFFAIITGIAFIAFIIKVMKDKPLPDDEFPLSDEKKAAEKDVAQIKEEIKELEQKEYSDEDINERFNTKV